jgi:hypothetical protein
MLPAIAVDHEVPALPRVEAFMFGHSDPTH